MRAAGGAGAGEAGDGLRRLVQPLRGESEDAVVILCGYEFVGRGFWRAGEEGVLAGDGRRGGES